MQEPVEASRAPSAAAPRRAVVGDGNGWVWCSRGEKHWGRYGAAGLLLRHLDATGRSWVLLQHRVAWSHHGDTWGVPGGALDSHESAQAGALREAGEEVAVDLQDVRVVGRVADDHGGWTYTTLLGECAELLPASPRSHETADVRWVPAEEVGMLPLHPGFAQSWPLLQDAWGPDEPVG